MGLFKSHNVVHKDDKIANFTVATAEYGSAVPEILGTTRVAGNIIFYDDFTAHEHRETQRTGKGGHSKVTNITYTYTVAVMIGLCEGPISNIGRVWINKDLFDYPAEPIQMTLFNGKANQQPWPYLVGKHPDKALSYSGLAYMAGVIDLDGNGSMPNYNFEIKGKLLDTGDGVDVNPADYIAYILNRIGMGDTPIEGLDNYRKYCREADLLISTPSDAGEVQKAREIINEITKLTNAIMFWSNNKFKIVVTDDRAIGSWQPNRQIIYDLTTDDLIEQKDGACVVYNRKDSSEIYNRFIVEFSNRENGYEKESVSFEDVEDIKNFGLRGANKIDAHYIYRKSRAVRIAESMARKSRYERNKYTFKLDWAFCRLEPGDLVRLTDLATGINKQVAMIDSVTEAANGLLTFTAISRANGDYSSATYDVHEIDRPFLNYNPEPGYVDYPAVFQPDASLMMEDNELWIAVKGQREAWGGCNVWVSDNNTHYRRLGEIKLSARMGELITSITAASTSLEVAINGQLVSGSEQDAERGNTLLWVDGESMSYTTASLLGNGHYRLDGLVRGQYNTQATNHKAGITVVRCDEAILKAPFLDDDIGKKIYLKFTSYNIFGGNEQSLADVSAYTYTLDERTTIPPDVTALDAEVLYNGTRRYYWKFDYPELNNITGFRMKYIQGNTPNWGAGFEVQDGLLVSQPYETSTVRQGTHTIMIKAVNKAGNESVGFASTVVNFAEPLEDNVLYRVDFSQGNWDKVSTDGKILEDGFIHAKMDTTHFSAPNSFYWEGPAETYWNSISYAPFYLSAVVKAPASGNFYFTYDIMGVSNITYRVKNKDSLFKPYATKFNVAADDEIEIRFDSPAGKQETVLKKLVAVIDVPDREEHFENITVPAGGLELPVKTPHYITTAVRLDSIQLVNGQPIYPYIVSKAPCRIKLVNDHGQPVEATIDVTWQGFINELI